MYAGWESDLAGWYSAVATGLAGIRDAYPQDVKEDYDRVMELPCGFVDRSSFSSVFAAAAAAATSTGVSPAGVAAGGGAPAGEVHVLGLVLAGMVGVVAVM